MSGPPSSALLAHIDPLRARIIVFFCAVTLLFSFLSAGWLMWGIPGASQANLLNARLLLLQGTLALIAGVLAITRGRVWSSRLLAIDLIILPTLNVFAFGIPKEVALAAYVGALLVTAVGAYPLEVLLATLVVAVLGVVAGVREAAQAHRFQTLTSIAGLLFSTGVALAWLLEALRRAILGLEASEAHFHRLSHLDPLTGLGNRRQFDESLEQLLNPHPRGRAVALVVLDVDNLKQINDRHGHPAGDDALRTVASAILGSVRDDDIAARIGGDEFAVILASGGMRGAQQIANRIGERLDALLPSEGKPFECTVSMGVAELSVPGQSPEQLLAAADAALYANREHLRTPVNAA